MTIPTGGIEVKHTAYPSHLAKHELGLIQPATKDDGTEVEVEIYKQEVDADGNGKVHEMEVWEFFTGNIDSLSKEGVLNVIVAIRLGLQKSPRPLSPESKRFKTYQALFVKASQSKDPEIRATAEEALEILEPGKTPHAEPEIKEYDNMAIAKVVEQVKTYKSAKNATLLGQLAVVDFKSVKDYKDVLIEASQSDIFELRQAAMDAMKIFLAMEQGYYQARPEEKTKTAQPYTLLPAPQNLQMCLEKTELPEGYIEVEIAEIIEKKTGETRKAIVDGDTIKIMLNGKMAGVRFKGANTTEFGKGPTLESRLKKAEPGATKAWEELKGLLALADYKVHVRPDKLDHYGRFISQVFVKAAGGKFIDVEAFLINSGLGMAYFVQVTDPQAYSCLLSLQGKAQQARIGIWSQPEFWDRNNPEGNKPKTLHITSFHPKGGKDKGIEEPLYNEYFRLVNISGEPVNLMDYVIFNKASGKKVALPYFIVPPGRTIKIASGDIKTNADPDNPEKDLVLSLLFNSPFWENKDEGGACLILRDLEGRTVDASAKYGYSGCK